MKTRLIAATALAACLVLLGLVILACVAVFSPGIRSSLVTREQYDLISVGMSEADLENALGPPRNEFRNPVIVWAPQGDGKVISAEIAPGTPNVQFFPNAGTLAQGREIVWLGKSGLIAANVDQHGRLRDKYFSTVHDAGRPSAIDWIRSRPEEFSRILNKR
jgi:hypothetical protein